ncbi:MAG: hypothetical protein AAF957_21990 [Planctomycetota bacterium]
MLLHLASRVYAATLLTCALSASATADVLLVGLDHPDLQSAIDAANDGDTIVLDDVGSQAHMGAIVGKSLTLVGRPGVRPRISRLHVEGIGPSGSVVVRDLYGRRSWTEPWLTARDCEGVLLLDDLWATSEESVTLDLVDCASVILRRCRVEGAYYGFTPIDVPTISAVRSSLSAYECELIGPEGQAGTSGFSCTGGGYGGTTLELRDSSEARVASSDLIGGPGGLGGWSSSGPCSDGAQGAAAEVDATSRLDLVATDVFGSIDGGGATSTTAGPERGVSAPLFGLSRESATFTAHGEPGDTVVLLVGSTLARRTFPVDVGPLFVGVLGLERRVLGTIDGTGRLQADMLLPVASFTGLRWFAIQPAFLDTAGHVRLGAPQWFPLVGTGGPILAGPDPVLVDAAAPGGLGATWSTASNDLDATLRRTWSRRDLPPKDVWVAAGTYRPRGPSEPFVVSHGTRMLGGFLPGMTSASDRRPYVHVTRLDADLLGDDGPGDVNRTDNAFRLLEVRGRSTIGPQSEDPTSIARRSTVDGFELSGIDGRNATSSPRDGVRLLDAATLERSVVAGCVSRPSSALIQVWTADADLGDTTPRLDRVRVFGNRGRILRAQGSGIGRRIEIVGILVHDNSGDGPPLEVGPLLEIRRVSARILSSTIARNELPSGQTALRLEPSSGNSMRVGNSIVFGNRSGGTVTFDAQVELDGDTGIGSTDFRFDRCLVSDWPGFPLAGIATSGADPLFLDPLGVDGVPGTVDDDYRLSAGSPGVDSGDNVLVGAGMDFDLDGAPRIADDPMTPDTGAGSGAIVDRGAYERQP